MPGMRGMEGETRVGCILSAYYGRIVYNDVFVEGGGGGGRIFRAGVLQTRR